MATNPNLKNAPALHCPATCFNGLAAITAGADLVTLPLRFSEPARNYLAHLDLREMSRWWQERDDFHHNRGAGITTSESFNYSALTKPGRMSAWLRDLFPQAHDPQGAKIFAEELATINEQIYRALNPEKGLPGRFQIRLPVPNPDTDFTNWLQYHQDGPTGLINLRGNGTAYRLNPPDNIAQRYSNELPPDWQYNTPCFTLHNGKVWHASPIPPATGRLIYQTSMEPRPYAGLLNRLHGFRARLA